MAGSGRKNADDALALALATGKSVPDAAKSCGVSERTAYRRLDSPAFRKKVRTLRAKMIDQVLGRMVDGMSDAVDVLRTLLNARSESVALGAARSILELSVNLGYAVDLEERLTAVEKYAIDKRANKRKP
jgi:hypothetical protein